MASGVDARLLKSTKFPPEFSQKVDMQKVNLQVIKKLVLVQAALSAAPSVANASPFPGGSPAACPKSLGTKTMLSSSYAST
jgi:hypothetical protein